MTCVNVCADFWRTTMRNNDMRLVDLLSAGKKLPRDVNQTCAA